jgi:RNA polymerase sigma-70 factor, ECF subfamily
VNLHAETSGLKSLAYRMLGSVADAEDVVQEAHLRLHLRESKPENQQAFLYRVVSNLCVDKLRAEKVRRNHYIGPWLPEPWADDDAEVAELAQQLNLGFLLLLERLSPKERIVFVLREGFDFSFTEVAQILETSPANARQLAHRARRRLADRPPVMPPQPSAQKLMLQDMMLCVAQGDVDGLVRLMSDDVVAYTDGGGVVSAAITPITEPARIAQVTMHLAQKAAQKAARQGALEYALRKMNGGWGLVITLEGAVHSCLQVDVADRRIQTIYVVRNPHKLARLAPV